MTIGPSPQSDLPPSRLPSPTPHVPFTLPWEDTQERPASWGGEAAGPDEPDEPWEEHDEGPWSESPVPRPFPSAPIPVPATRPQVRNWLSALSAGWRAGQWCLRRQPGRLP